jgi:hypothetical protein
MRTMTDRLSPPGGLGRRAAALTAAGLVAAVAAGGSVAAADCVPPGGRDARPPSGVELSADATTVYLSGVIHRGTPWEIYDLPETVRLAVLDSPGGIAYEGARIAQEFRRRRITTYVAEGAACLSICTLAFQGGAHRVAHPEATFGYHAAGVPPDRLAALGDEMARWTEVRRLGRTNTLLRAVYQMYGTPRDLVDEILKTPPTGMLPKTARDLLRAGVVHAIEDLHPEAPEAPCGRAGGEPGPVRSAPG